MRRFIPIALVGLAALGLVACGDGEDRPGTVTEEGGTGTGSGTASGTGTHTGSASGTGTGTAEPAFEESDADAVVKVTMEDFAFVGLPSTVRGPKVFFEATNKGPAEHELEILDEDGDALGEIEAMKVGRSGELALELEPGRYVAQCLVETDGKPHTELGMKTTFSVE